MMTLPVAEVIVILFPVVFMTGPIVALGSNVIAFAVVVLFITSAFDGVEVPIPTFFELSLGKIADPVVFQSEDVVLWVTYSVVKLAFPNLSPLAS